MIALDLLGWRYSPAFESLLWAPISGTFAIAIALVPWAWPRQRDTHKSLPRRLAQFSLQQWRAEAIIRGMRNPAPLSLEWRNADRVLVDSSLPPLNLTGELVPGIRESPDSATLDGITRTFNRVPSGQLVVLGVPGSGKTALAVHLITSLTGAAKPTPAVLLPLASWNCEKQTFHEWALSRMTQDYPRLVPTGKSAGERIVGELRELLKSGGVVLVLDGLDELPTSLRRETLGQLNAQLADERIFLTCRSDEYREMGRALSRSAVIEIRPLSLGKVKRYLESASLSSGSAHEWTPVLAELDNHPAGPLARALQTPLMTWLARTLFSDRAEPPGRVLERGSDGRRLFQTPEAIENYLLDHVISAIYARTMVDGARYRRVSQRSAGRWLTFLAVHLASCGTYDLALWHLHRSMNKASKFLVHGCSFGTVIGVSGALLYSLKFGLSFGLITGVSAGTAAACAGPAEPPYGGKIDENVLEKYKSGIYFTVSLWIASGLAAAISLGFRAGILVWGWEALAAMLAGGLTVLLSMTRIDKQNEAASTPRVVLRLSRRVTVVWASIFGALLGLGMGLSEGAHAAVVAALIGLLGAVLANAWGGFAATRGYLAIRRRLPWRLMGFLADAHHRGILRQVGAVYQFRHAIIRDRLVTQARASGNMPAEGLHVPAARVQPSPARPVGRRRGTRDANL
jgi:hypothetical protein